MSQIAEGEEKKQHVCFVLLMAHMWSFVVWASYQAMSARGRPASAGSPYFAGAISLVFHPINPYVPTFRSDVRYFQVITEDQIYMQCH